MDARNLTAIPHSDAGSLEVIVPDGDAAIRWSSHGYPSSLAKWHYHPQIEIHLIREEVDNSWRGMDSCHSCRGMWRSIDPICLIIGCRISFLENGSLIVMCYAIYVRRLCDY